LPTPEIDFVATVPPVLLTGMALAEPEFEPELELPLPPHAARPMATRAMAARVRSGARLSLIFGSFAS
jgi:hypothetical protein